MKLAFIAIMLCALAGTGCEQGSPKDGILQSPATLNDLRSRAKGGDGTYLCVASKQVPAKDVYVIGIGSEADTGPTFQSYYRVPKEVFDVIVEKKLLIEQLPAIEEVLNKPKEQPKQAEQLPVQSSERLGRISREHLQATFGVVKGKFRDIGRADQYVIAIDVNNERVFLFETDKETYDAVDIGTRLPLRK